MKNIPLLVFLLFFSLPSFANEEEYVTFDLVAMRNNKVTEYLRQTFDQYTSHPENARYNIPKITPRQLKIMKEKFIVLDIASGPFGGYFLDIVTTPKKASHKFYFWQIWIYDISGNNSEFQIRHLKETPVIKKDEESFLPLISEANLQYWL